MSNHNKPEPIDGQHQRPVEKDDSSLAVYPGMPVTVHDVVGWVDEVVSATGQHTDSYCCSDPSPYFYVQGIAGHWHLSKQDDTWIARRELVGSPESILAELLFKLVPNLDNARQAARMAVEFCVTRLGRGVSWPGDPVACSRSSSPPPEVKIQASLPGGDSLGEIDDLLSRLRTAVHKLGGGGS